MIKVYVCGKCFSCADLSEVRGVLQSHVDAHIGVRAAFSARNPHDKMVTYEGDPSELIKQLDEEWNAYKIVHRAYWGY